MSERPIPDELWLPLKRRIEMFHGLVVVSMTAIVVAAIALLSVWWAPTWVAFRVGAPLGIVGMVAGHVAMARGRRELAKMRLLIIKYHGIDPGGPQ